VLRTNDGNFAACIRAPSGSTTLSGRSRKQSCRSLQAVGLVLASTGVPLTLPGDIHTKAHENAFIQLPSTKQNLGFLSKLMLQSGSFQFA
jgi:hypothetical protein